MERWRNNYFMAFILRLHVVRAVVQHSLEHVQLITKNSSTRIRIPKTSFEQSKHSRAELHEANLWSQGSRKNFRHLINVKQVCVFGNTCRHPTKFMAKSLRRKFNLFMFQVLRVPRTLPEHLRHDCGLNFQCVNIEQDDESLNFSCYKFFEKFSLLSRVGKLHKSFIDIAAILSTSVFSAKWFFV